MTIVGGIINQTGRERRHNQKVITRKARPARSWLVAPNSGQRISPPLPAELSVQVTSGGGSAAVWAVGNFPTGPSA